MIPVVLLHALSLDSSMWAEQREALTLLGHRVITPDQRGFGGTPLGDAPPSLDVVADDLAATLDALGVAGVAVVGSSMGGYVAMAFQRRFPQRVRALALLATRAGADSPEVRAGREAFAERIVDDRSRDGLIAATTPALLGATTRAEQPELVAKVRGMVEQADPASVAWAQRAIAARPDSFPTLRATSVPSVVIAGAQDELVPVSEADAMANALPHCRLVTIPDAGHLTPLEAPDRVTAELTDLLRSVHVD
ncbi:alpha/beta fold hydrolase [Saccharothrix deserti]|uniref:alpha/beta fold hydrolase n=1 Tax=Saccharothrix deserti TaxID=2593674 RepID=UPI001EE457A6|nr:alpha/beta hydrolase [Saccharothrix deserti]